MRTWLWRARRYIDDWIAYAYVDKKRRSFVLAGPPISASAWRVVHAYSPRRYAAATSQAHLLPGLVECARNAIEAYVAHIAHAATPGARPARRWRPVSCRVVMTVPSAEETPPAARQCVNRSKFVGGLEEQADFDKSLTYVSGYCQLFAPEYISTAARPSEPDARRRADDAAAVARPTKIDEGRLTPPAAARVHHAVPKPAPLRRGACCHGEHRTHDASASRRPSPSGGLRVRRGVRPRRRWPQCALRSRDRAAPPPMCRRTRAGAAVVVVVMAPGATHTLPTDLACAAQIPQRRRQNQPRPRRGKGSAWVEAKSRH